MHQLAIGPSSLLPPWTITEKRREKAGEGLPRSRLVDEAINTAMA